MARLYWIIVYCGLAGLRPEIGQFFYDLFVVQLTQIFNNSESTNPSTHATDAFPGNHAAIEMSYERKVAFTGARQPHARDMALDRSDERNKFSDAMSQCRCRAPVNTVNGKRR